MRYTFFEFENFKGIRNARLDLTGVGSGARVFTLVGLNESGKTTVLQAVDHFQRASGGGEVRPKQLGGWEPPDAHELIPIAERANFNGSVVIKCGVELDNADVEAIREALRKSTGFRLRDIDRVLTIADEYQYENSEFKLRRSVWEGVSATGMAKTGSVQRTVNAPGDRNWQELTSFIRRELPPIWFFPNFLFDFPERIYLEPRDGEPEADRFYRDLFQDILDALDSGLRIDKHIVERARSRRSSAARHLQQVLLDASREVTQTVVSSWNRIFADRPINKRVQIDIGEEEVAGDDQSGRLYLEFRLDEPDGFFLVQEKSLGFRWFFVYLLMTTYRGRRRGAPKDMLFLFDEPASNLHSTAQSALLASLADLSTQAVVIYTTHSHHLIEPKWLGTTFVVTNEGFDPSVLSADTSARRTDIKLHPYRQFAAEHPNQSRFFQPILDVLDYAPSRLELVPSVVMVEGKTDFYLLSYFQEVILKAPEVSRVNLLPGGGAGTLDQPIQLYLGWSRPFVVLLDSDVAGHREAARYLEKFGPILKSRMIDARKASGVTGVRGLETLLPTEDRLQVQRLFDPGTNRYTKKDFSRSVQEALVTTQAAPISMEARDAMTSLLASLKEALTAVEVSS